MVCPCFRKSPASACWPRVPVLTLSLVLPAPPQLPRLRIRAHILEDRTSPLELVAYLTYRRLPGCYSQLDSAVFTVAGSGKRASSYGSSKSVKGSEERRGGEKVGVAGVKVPNSRDKRGGGTMRTLLCRGRRRRRRSWEAGRAG